MEWEKIHRSIDDIEVVGCVYLWEYEHDFDALYWRLKELYQESYAPNQKIVIVHEDNDYYYHGNSTGFYIHNLMSVLSHLNISPGVLIFLSNHVGLPVGLEPFITHDSDRPMVIHCFLGMTAPKASMDLRHCNTEKHIQKNALCLLGTARTHRILLYQLMSMLECFDGVDVNLANPNAQLSQLVVANGVDKFIDPLSSPVKNQGIVYSIPHRLNDTWTKYLRLPELIKASTITVPDKLVQPGLQGNIPDFYNNYGIEILVETSFDYPFPHVTEKIFRPLFMSTPFVLVGPAGYLKYLHSHGFKTFDDFWDESYDDIVDPQHRLLACAQVIKEIASWPLQRVKDMCEALQDRLDHNRKNILHYVDNVYAPVYNKLSTGFSNL